MLGVELDKASRPAKDTAEEEFARARGHAAGEAGAAMEPEAPSVVGSIRRPRTEPQNGRTRVWRQRVNTSCNRLPRSCNRLPHSCTFKGLIDSPY